ncbi:MAG: hypothetical protein LBH46_01480, partial [Rickettsiales bacterium]|nr:hypothetical protein [Rickettsiales bacterium]
GGRREKIEIIEKTGLKTFYNYSYYDRKYINDWLPKTKPNDPNSKTAECDIISPPLSNPLEIYKSQSNIKQDKINKYQIGYISGFMGNDFQHNNLVYTLSSPAGHGHGNGIVPFANLTQSLIYLAVRKCIAPTWLNDRDQFLAPNKELSKEFIGNCVIYALFNGANNTSDCTLNYKNKDWKIVNYFFPYTPQDLNILPADFSDYIAKKEIKIFDLVDKKYENFYMPDYLKEFEFTSVAGEVYKICKQIYILYEDLLKHGTFDKVKTALQLNKNAGWYQIKRAFTMSANLKSYNASKIDEWIKTLRLEDRFREIWSNFDTKYNDLRIKVEDGVWEFGFLI